MNITLDLQPWRVVVRDDAEPYRFAPASVITRSVTAQPSTIQFETCAVVQVYAQMGGVSPTALLGGSFWTSTNSRLEMSLSVGQQNEFGPLVKDMFNEELHLGLPLEYSEAIFNALGNNDGVEIPAGELTVFASAHDEVNSSPFAFGRAAELLRWALLSRASGDGNALDLEQLIARWKS